MRTAVWVWVVQQVLYPKENLFNRDGCAPVLVFVQDAKADGTRRIRFDVAGMFGLNGARHASVAENRKRRKLTSGERAEETTQAKKRLSSVKMAETVYG